MSHMYLTPTLELAVAARQNLRQRLDTLRDALWVGGDTLALVL